VVGSTLTASANGSAALGVRCPAGDDDCRVDVHVRGRKVTLHLRNRRVPAGARRDLRLRLPAAARDGGRLTVTIVTRTADGQATTTTARIAVRRRS
jgi:hypothetical protein